MKIVHCKRDKYDVYIGRPSKWGNPYVIGKDGSREEVIKKYEEYILNSPELLAALPELEGKILGCWCAPKPCHGEVLLKLLERSKKMNSSNPIKNELEMLLACTEKLLKDKIKDNPKAGLAVDKNNKMRYSEALKCLYRLNTYFRISGAFSFGLCISCTHYKTEYYTQGDGSLGKCRGGKMVRCYDTCENHSEEGGGPDL
jgi:hypothetical protein